MEIKENIFTRFIKFIKKIFESEEPKQIPAKTEVMSKPEFVKQEPKSNFMNELRLNKEENSSLLELQNQFEKNEIDLRVMSNEQIHDLNSLYKRQVSELKKKLNDKKTELSIMQHRIKSYSSNM